MKLTKTQQALLDAIGRKKLVVWWGDGGFYQIGTKPGYYSAGAVKRAQEQHVTMATVRSAIKAGLLKYVTWFAADACGNRAQIYRKAP